ncbi:hypothetical protein ON05_019640 [Acaryochloris sp. CCMEE 5410]|nr:hypothetical protein ON05_019640 [Acaryochloris sp. CCMEE 5410]
MSLHSFLKDYENKGFEILLSGSQAQGYKRRTKLKNPPFTLLLLNGALITWVTSMQGDLRNVAVLINYW